MQYVIDFYLICLFIVFFFANKFISLKDSMSNFFIVFLLFIVMTFFGNLFFSYDAFILKFLFYFVVLGSFGLFYLIKTLKQYTKNNFFYACWASFIQSIIIFCSSIALIKGIIPSLFVYGNIEKSIFITFFSPIIKTFGYVFNVIYFYGN